MKHCTEIYNALKAAGVDATLSADPEHSKGQQISIEIPAPPTDIEVTLFFDVDQDGNETFVCQE